MRYLIRYLDQAGDPVPGVTCQVCSEEICTFHQSDENGAIELFLAPGAWEIHTLKIPEGYSGDTSSDTIASPEGGEYLFTLTKTD